MINRVLVWVRAVIAYRPAFRKCSYCKQKRRTQDMYECKGYGIFCNEEEFRKWWADVQW